MKGRCVVVTGASRGIGRAIALLFAERGADVVANGTNAAALLALQSEIARGGGRCEVCAGDIADPETATAIVDAALRAFGRVDALVNNAGVNDRTPTLSLTREQWRRVLDVNLNGTFYMTTAVLPHMARAGRGAIVSVTSTAAKTAKANAAVSYGASKAAVNAMTRHWALEFAPFGIRVNAVCPGPVRTDMTAQWTDDQRETLVRAIPLGRVGEPREVAEVVVFLCGEGAGFITGETINVNGGSYMN